MERNSDEVQTTEYPAGKETTHGHSYEEYRMRMYGEVPKTTILIDKMCPTCASLRFSDPLWVVLFLQTDGNYTRWLSTQPFDNEESAKKHAEFLVCRNRQKEQRALLPDCGYIHTAFCVHVSIPNFERKR